MITHIKMYQGQPCYVSQVIEFNHHFFERIII